MISGNKPANELRKAREDLSSDEIESYYNPKERKGLQLKYCFFFRLSTLRLWPLFDRLWQQAKHLHKKG